MNGCPGLAVENEAQSFLLEGFRLALSNGIPEGSVPILSMTESLYIDGSLVDEAVVSFGFGSPAEHGALMEVTVGDQVFFIDAKIASQLPSTLIFHRARSGQRVLKLAH